MTDTEVRVLLKEVMVACDAGSGGLMDRRDLQELLRRSAEAIRCLQEECDRLNGRLRRTFDTDQLAHASA